MAQRKCFALHVLVQGAEDEYCLASEQRPARWICIRTKDRNMIKIKTEIQLYPFLRSTMQFRFVRLPKPTQTVELVTNCIAAFKEYALQSGYTLNNSLKVQIARAQ